MSLSPTDGEKTGTHRLLPWLCFLGALLVVFLNAAFAAVHSPLAHDISAGESPGFDWLRTNITACIGIGLAYLIVVCWFQLRQLRQPAIGDNRWPSFLVCLQILGVAVIALLLYFRQPDQLPLIFTFLLISLLFQGVAAFQRLGLAKLDHESLISQRPGTNGGLFLVLLFILSSLISLLVGFKFFILIKLDNLVKSQNSQILISSPIEIIKCKI